MLLGILSVVLLVAASGGQLAPRPSIPRPLSGNSWAKRLGPRVVALGLVQLGQIVQNLGIIGVVLPENLLPDLRRWSNDSLVVSPLIVTLTAHGDYANLQGSRQKNDPFEFKMSSKSKPPEIPLSKSWDTHVRSAILHMIALAQYALTYSRSWAADSTNQRVQLKADTDRLTQEVAQLREEIRIKDVRMAQIDPKRRPHYPPTQRMAILELRASRGWSLEQAAKVFLVTAETISSWVRRIDEAGTEALVRTVEPVNKFPELIRYLVQRLKVSCPSLGKQKIAQVLCRAGLHLGATTVGRILKEDPHPKPAEKGASPTSAKEAAQAQKPSNEAAKRVVTAKRINHVWHVDLTLVPTQLGLWTSWLPFSLPQCWPFGYARTSAVPATSLMPTSYGRFFDRGAKNRPPWPSSKRVPKASPASPRKSFASASRTCTAKGRCRSILWPA